jgi:SAM-dependent methyltransferase
VLHADRLRAESFGSVAALYDGVRPSYPAALIDELMAERPCDVLDVGAGTGIAGALLVQRGASVLGVEVDERMAEIARSRGLTVEIAAFESWEPAGRRFDLLISGQAWHWIDPAAGAAKAAAVLRCGGRACLFWNHGDPPAPVRERLAPIYERLAPELENYSALPGGGRDSVAYAAEALERSGEFDAARIRGFSWSETYAADAWVDLLRTHSDHQTMAPSRREPLLRAVRDAIDELGGSFALSYEAVLVDARRR